MDALSVMSGAEADVSSDESSEEDLDIPLPASPLQDGTDAPFRVVLKGGEPWGFTLKPSPANRTGVQIDEVCT